MEAKIMHLDVKDVRFPTSLTGDGSDAMHTDPDYSCAYVILTSSDGTYGYGFTFTIGKGTEIVVAAVKALAPLVVGKIVQSIFDDFSKFWRELTSHSQLRWIGPEKGVIHLATAAIVNALWDLWARREGKPLWKLLVDMSPKQLVSTIDFRYITDVITKGEAIELLKKKDATKKEREAKLLHEGYPAYCTSVGWIGYSDEKIRELCKQKLKEGFTAFKVKVGQNLDDDKRRLAIIREEIGKDSLLMVDANQIWDVKEAIFWMTELKEFNLLWIEEPTSPDDILGHAFISKALKPYGIGVASGEQCHNRVMFKQFLQASALQFCQIDSCRLGGVNEILSVYLMAAKFGVPVCPHAGGVGLCELVQHLAAWDFISVSGCLQNRMVEYVEHLHEHFENPVIVRKGRYSIPLRLGYSTKMKDKTISDYQYPDGNVWKAITKKGTL
ncbi:mitochondrial enolase superfamily member 1-like isoform X1 [Argiope bruennichi]|uniref:mitochondrial enolase superfamily member 1-like isoform X1 n=1 Tax=Argiope bruennichi TaxID=94029 RepID=UPI0024958742|nr:mitochondrial enolase superfamily member 1-like isoform X1 [Argiope bruennichi]